jgi:hypothetical protein
MIKPPNNSQILKFYAKNVFCVQDLHQIACLRKMLTHTTLFLLSILAATLLALLVKNP